MYSPILSKLGQTICSIINDIIAEVENCSFSGWMKTMAARKRDGFLCMDIIKPCLLCRIHIYWTIFIFQLGQNIYSNEFFVQFENGSWSINNISARGGTFLIILLYWNLQLVNSHVTILVQLPWNLFIKFVKIAYQQISKLVKVRLFFSLDKISAKFETVLCELNN